MSEVSEGLNPRTLERWNVDLHKSWSVAHLPVIVCERRLTENGILQGRSADAHQPISEYPWFNLLQPVLLETHREAKPWGAEIWYTGIEKRGVCRIRTKEGLVIPLPEYLSLLAGPAGVVRPPSLLKILDPLPDPHRGSLYIEVHQEKWETYIVTAVSASLYPDGAGQLLIGFSPEKLAQFSGNEDLFRKSLLADVRNYEIIRRVLDGEWTSENLTAAGVAQGDNLTRVAAELWEKVGNYFVKKKVRVGDVIQVPTLIPHSLQAGVRVVEFQTPTYERLILAFNQKVLTQPNWNSEKAIEVAQFENPAHDNPCADAQEWVSIVDFPEFAVLRRSLLPGIEEVLPLSQSSGHSLLFVISGEIAMMSGQGEHLLTLCGEQAALIPDQLHCNQLKMRNVGLHKALVLFV